MSKSKNPLQATGHQICNETGRGIFDPRGNRQMDAQACPFDSLHTGIKICGLTRPEDIAAVNEYRPDYIGFVFAPSRRNVSEMRAAGLKKLLSPEIMAVGVFVNSPIEDIVRIASRGIIDAVQLHGDMDGFETARYAENLKKALAAAGLAASVPLIRAVRVKDRNDIQRAVSYPAEYLLFDTFVKDQYGGSGVRFDWSLIPHIEKPWFLAGGLSAATIKEALKTEACCLDLSSAAETGGRKDPKKIQEIIQTVRSA